MLIRIVHINALRNGSKTIGYNMFGTVVDDNHKFISAVTAYETKAVADVLQNNGEVLDDLISFGTSEGFVDLGEFFQLKQQTTYAAK